MMVAEKGLRIRSMAPGDLDRVSEIERMSFSAPWSLDFFRKILRWRPVVALVLAGDEGIVGYAIARFVGGEGELVNLAVAPEERGRGAGGRLLDRVIEEVASRGVRTLHLEVRLSGERAQALYRSRGFRPVGRRRDYYRNPREDALVMALDLGRAGEPRGTSVDEREWRP